MGCDSVYRNGYQNVFEDPDGRKLAEARALCQEILEPLLGRSRLSVSYGYISPELSRRIVKYQDPNKPSYHRWDSGAACDVVLHEEDGPPIFSAFWIDENLPVSRVITYSESPFLCVASRLEEIRSGDPRRALYENRYVGQRKPKFINYSNNPESRLRQKDSVALEYDWEGAGYPTYHGGGRQQFHHRRTSAFTVLSDFLYNSEAVEEGYANAPPNRAFAKFKKAGEVYDGILKSLSIRRMSIVRGYESPEWVDGRHNWADGVYLVVVPPASTDPRDILDAALALDDVDSGHVVPDTARVALRINNPA